MDIAAESDPDASDQPSAHNTSSSAAILSTSLERLSINPSTGPPPSSPATAPVSPTQTRKPPIQRSHTQDNQPRTSSRRRSSGGLAPPTPAHSTSPRLTRRSSGLSQGNGTPSKASPRRNSSQNLNSRPSTANAPSTSSIPEDGGAPWTAASVASDYFKRELESHSPSDYNRPDTIVIIHDSCYGHRFSRRKTTKTNLSLIVERPERIKAGVLGMSSAYVRLGERHAAGRHQPHPHRSPPPNVPFLISKSTRSTPLTSSAVTNVHGTKWMHDLTTMCNAAQARLAAGTKELARPDTPSTTVKPKLHEGDLYLCQESLDAFQGALGGVLDAVDAVFGYDYSLPEPSTLYKKAFVCVRPPGHHCSADMPSGFCWLNNVHVGIEHAALSHGLTHAAIIDFDLHHGDGSQAITWERNAKAARMPKNSPISKKTSIGYFSLHDINSYPCEWGDPDKVQSASLCIENAHNQSIWNVHLQPWKTEEDFWHLYETRYLVLLEKARAFLKAQTSHIQSTSSAVKPKAALFISAGFDASEWEGEGMQRHKVNVPTEFYARFTADIIKMADEMGTSVDGRVVSVLEGGYSDRALMSGIMSHLSGLAGPEKSDVNNSSTHGAISAESSHHTFHKEWWGSAALSELETVMNQTPALPASRKIRSSELSTFATPTQSFTAKVVDPSKVYRSLSGAAPPPAEPPRPPTPPPPDVDWAVAAYELSKLLIPVDRRVDSYRHDELAEPRVKPERYSTMGLSSTGVLAQQPLTRGRKAKTPAYAGPAPVDKRNDTPRKPSNSRRRTLSDLPTVSDEGPTAAIATPQESLERPTTADSKAHSEGYVATWDAVPNDSTSTENHFMGELRPGKTRRQSGILADIQRLNEESSSIPNSQPSTRDEVEEKPLNGNLAPDALAPQAAQSDSGQNTDVDRLTSGVKKITLRMNPKVSAEPKPAPAKKAAAKAPRKSTAPRAPKPAATAPKATSARSAKATTAVTGTSTAIPASGAPGPPVVPNATVHQSEDHPLPKIGDIPTTAQVLTDHATSLPTPPNLENTPAEQLTSAPWQIDDSSADRPSVWNGDARSSSKASSGITDTDKQGQEHFQEGKEQVNHPMSSIPGMEFVPYQPSHGPSSFTSVKPEALTWLPPNTNTPTGTPVAKRGKENLPVFSAHGPIPFAVPPPTSGPDSKPATTMAETHISHQAPTAIGSAHKPLAEEQTARKAEEDSIWEVSDSPPRRA